MNHTKFQPSSSKRLEKIPSLRLETDTRQTHDRHTTDRRHPRLKNYSPRRNLNSVVDKKELSLISARSSRGMPTPTLKRLCLIRGEIPPVTRVCFVSNSFNDCLFVFKRKTEAPFHPCTQVSMEYFDCSVYMKLAHQTCFGGWFRWLG